MLELIAALNALLIGGDVVIDNIAKTGEVDWNSVAISSGTAGAIGAVLYAELSKVFQNNGK